MGILFRHVTNVILTGYMDVDWERGLEIQQLTLRIILKFWYTLVMWNNKLQSTIGVFEHENRMSFIV
jgi:hypothetical protein